MAICLSSGERASQIQLQTIYFVTVQARAIALAPLRNRLPLPHIKNFIKDVILLYHQPSVFVLISLSLLFWRKPTHRSEIHIAHATVTEGRNLCLQLLGDHRFSGDQQGRDGDGVL